MRRQFSWFYRLMAERWRNPGAGLDAWLWLPDVYELLVIHEDDGTRCVFKDGWRTWYWTRGLVLTMLTDAKDFDLRSLINPFSAAVSFGLLGVLETDSTGDTPPDPDHLTIAAGNGPLGLVLRT